MTATELVHHYEPWGAAAAVMECQDLEVLLSGPAGTGKSRGALEKLHLLALANPGFQGLIVRKTRVSLAASALQTWTKFVAKEAIAAGVVRYFGGNDERPAAYEYSNGSAVVVGGMDKPAKVMSTEYDVIFVQEAIEVTEEDWESLMSRLRNRRISFQQIIGDTNPAHPTHWLKQRCDRGATTMLHCRHEDNPVFFNADGSRTEAGDQYVGQILDQLTGVRRLRLRDGVWAAAEGVIFDGWDDAVHLVDRFPIPWEWPRYWVIDFGFTNPFVCQWWAEDPDGRLIMYREIYRTQRIVEDHCRDILTAIASAGGDNGPPPDSYDGGWPEPPPAAIICDHDAEGRATLTKHLRMGTVRAKKDVVTGIELTQVRLRVQDDGRPRLMIMRDCLVERDPLLDSRKLPASTLEELPGYIWAPGPDGKPAKEEPLKLNDHGADAMRYMVAAKDLGQRPQVRWLGDTGE